MEVERILASRLYRKKTLQYFSIRRNGSGMMTMQRGILPVTLQILLINIRDFHRDYPHQPGPPKRLYYWLECWENEEDPRDHPADDIPA